VARSEAQATRPSGPISTAFAEARERALTAPLAARAGLSEAFVGIETPNPDPRTFSLWLESAKRKHDKNFLKI